MKIKTIEIIGFKSFYDRNKIRFHKGINAIVGPNGCGKSNILDAIRWVLGEQNPRKLRADGIEDFISNGSELLKPLGMAEVTLSIDLKNEDDFDQLILKRRLFRSGESEYTINGTPCRLKDISEMFLDTGAGARAYSVITQGEIDNLITSKPEEKRLLIEEVAGITRYKVRRSETESRIKSTKENLIRIDDMINEVKSQMNSLRKQAEKAKEYKRFHDEAKLLDLQINHAKFTNLNEKNKEIKTQIAALDSAINDIKEKLISVEEEINNSNNKSDILENDIENIERENFQIRSDLLNKESEQNILKSQITNTETYIQKIVEDKELLLNERKNLSYQITTKENSLHEVKTKIQSEKEILSEKQNDLSTKNEYLTNIQSKINSCRNDLLKTLEDLNVLKHSSSTIEKEISELEIYKNRIKKELSELISERNQVISSKYEIDKLKDENINFAKRISQHKEKINLSLENKQNKLNALLEMKKTFTDELNKNNYKLNALKQIQDNYEWLPEGIRSFIVENKGNGILGIIADYTKAPEGYEDTIESALGDKLKWVLVKNDEELFNTINYSRDKSLGRCTFVSLQRLSSFSQPEDLTHGAKPISEIVEVENIDKQLLGGIINGCYLVQSVKDGLDLAEKTNGNFSYVTNSGELIHPSGAVTFGANIDGIFERKREINEINETLKEMTKELDINGNDITSIEQEIELLVNELNKLNIEEREIEIAKIKINKDLDNLTDRLNQFEVKEEILNAELEKINKTQKEKTELIDKKLESIAELEDKKSDLELIVNELEEHLKNLEKEKRDLENNLEKYELSYLHLTDKENILRTDLENLHGRFSEIESRVEYETKEIEENFKKKKEIIKTHEENIEMIATLKELLEKRNQDLESLKKDKVETTNSLKELIRKKEELYHTISLHKENLTSFAIDLKSNEVETGHIQNKLGLGVHDENSELKDQIQGSTNEEILKQFDIEEEEERLVKLNRRIEAFGAVNLLAPEEFTKLEERYNFLNNQVDDLTNAISTLYKAIQKIDKESSVKFLEAFDMVNEKFQEISRRILGGEGKLIILEPDNLLDTGIEILIRPEGKRLQSINLLSGGEKALSTIALIMSACMVKPVPFLLFDEIDAPLDDTNSSKFMDLMNEITKYSQSIIITHNKKTMQSVKSLIGITSEDRGVSKVVSVELN